MKKHTTLVDSLNRLKEQGYTIDFNVREDCIFCAGENVALSPKNFKIDNVVRFEGATNPDDQAILYAISSKNSDMKGILVNGYGISADSAIDAIVSQLSTHPESDSIN